VKPAVSPLLYRLLRRTLVQQQIDAAKNTQFFRAAKVRVYAIENLGNYFLIIIIEIF